MLNPIHWFILTFILDFSIVGYGVVDFMHGLALYPRRALRQTHLVFSALQIHLGCPGSGLRVGLLELVVFCSW